jgi:hypothetical protein
VLSLCLEKLYELDPLGVEGTAAFHMGSGNSNANASTSTSTSTRASTNTCASTHTSTNTSTNAFTGAGTGTTVDGQNLAPPYLSHMWGTNIYTPLHNWG